MVYGDKRGEQARRDGPGAGDGKADRGDGRSEGDRERVGGGRGESGPEDVPQEARGLEGFARRAIESGVLRMLQTEEGIRSIAGAVVPRELINKTLDGVDTAKTEAVAVVGRELRTFLANLNVGEELAKILTSVSFEVRMQVRFVPNEDGTLRASVKSDGGPTVKVEPAARRRAAAAEAEAKTGARASAPEAVAAAVDSAADADGGARAAPAAGAEGGEGGDALRDAVRARRTIVKGVAMRIAERTAATARAAAEVAADAAAEVVNRSLEAGDDDDDDDDHELDSY